MSELITNQTEKVLIIISFKFFLIISKKHSEQVVNHGIPSLSLCMEIVGELCGWDHKEMTFLLLQPEVTQFRIRSFHLLSYSV